MTWSNGFVSVGIGFGGGYPGYRPPYGGWYGGGGYRPVTCIDCNINVGGGRGEGGRGQGGRGDAATRPSAGTQPANSIYNRADTRDRNASREATSRNKPQAAPATRGANNVLADRDGNVYRAQGGTMQSREGGQWKPSSSPPARPSTGQSTPSARPSTGASSAQRDWQSRQRGATREASRSRSYSGGGARGGGRRR